MFNGIGKRTSISAILTVTPKCTLAVSHVHCPLVSHGEYADGTDKQTDGRQPVTLRFPLDASNVTKRAHENALLQ